MAKDVYRGWSINLSSAESEHTCVIALPVPPLFDTSEGPVIEIVFWSHAVSRWIHEVSCYFERALPSGHVQVTVGDLEWIRRVVDRVGERGLIECVVDLERMMFPDAYLEEH